MKKLYHKGTVHPSPTLSSQTFDHFSSLSFLPTAILVLATALSTDEQEVLAYLLSCSTTKKHNKSCPSSNNNKCHATCFTCYCFTCYTSYWARWDSSPNRQLIHEIIDAFEDDLLAQRKKKQHGVNKKDKRTKNVNNKSFDYGANNKPNGSVRVNTDSSRVGSVENGGGIGENGDETGEKQGPVRKMVSFIWGSVWG